MSNADHLIPLSKLPDFDPRLVPVEPVAQQLPPVARDMLQPEALLARFANPPVWQPELRAEPRFTERKTAHAAVLMAIVLREEPTLLLTQRTAQMRTHSGQVAFPGGKVDDADTSHEMTALREAHEEVGLAPQHVQVAGALPSYTTGTAFIVTPVVGLVRPGFSLAPNPQEVADVFEVPLAFLMNPAHHRRHRWEAQGVVRYWYSMPYQDGVHERFIWGATAGMLRNLYHFLSA